MVTRMWVGGGANIITTPSNWNPVGAPEPDDLLIIGASKTANMIGGDLAGDTLELTGGTLNLYDHATLDSLVVGGGNSTVNVVGHDTIEALRTSFLPFGSVTLDIAPHSTLSMTVNPPATPDPPVAGPVAVYGLDKSSLLINDHPSFIQSGHIAVDVKGHGSWTPSGFFPSIEFDQGVGSGQSINLGVAAGLRIGDPLDFKGLVNLTSGGWLDFSLKGIHGNAFEYHDGRLKIESGHKLVDTIRVHEGAGVAFSISNTPDGISIHSTSGPQASNGQIT